MVRLIKFVSDILVSLIIVLFALILASCDSDPASPTRTIVAIQHDTVYTGDTVLVHDTISADQISLDFYPESICHKKPKDINYIGYNFLITFETDNRYSVKVYDSTHFYMSEGYYNKRSDTLIVDPDYHTNDTLFFHLLHIRYDIKTIFCDINKYSISCR